MPMTTAGAVNPMADAPNDKCPAWPENADGFGVEEAKVLPIVVFAPPNVFVTLIVVHRLG